jgi:hypothetical protein
MQNFVDIKLRNIAGKLEPMYQQLDELYEKLHTLEQQLSFLEEEYNRTVKLVKNPTPEQLYYATDVTLNENNELVLR